MTNHELGAIHSGLFTASHTTHIRSRLMTWVRIDDGFADHPKIVAAGPIAAIIQIRAMCWSARHLTDGFIPAEAFPTLLHGLERIGIETARNDLMVVGEDAQDIDWAAWLVLHGLLVKCLVKNQAGWRIHDYLKYNPSKAQVLEVRKKKQHAGHAGGQASAQARAQASARASASEPPNTPTPTPTTRTGVEPVDGVDNSPTRHARPAVDSTKECTLSQKSKRDPALTQEEIKGLSSIAQARGITLAQAKSELVAAKLRTRQTPP